MANNALEAIRAKLASMETKPGSNKSNFQSDNAIFPHWNIEELRETVKRAQKNISRPKHHKKFDLNRPL